MWQKRSNCDNDFSIDYRLLQNKFLQHLQYFFNIFKINYFSLKNIIIKLFLLIVGILYLIKCEISLNVTNSGEIAAHLGTVTLTLQLGNKTLFSLHKWTGNSYIYFHLGL